MKPAQAQPYYLFMSDEAYDYIVEAARSMGKVRGKNNAKGIRDYVEHIMACTLYDNRPDDVKAQDTDMLQAGYGPEWQLYTPRKRRGMSLRSDILIRASVIAVQLGIAYPPERRMIHAPTYIDGAQCLSAILEAIGTRWIGIEDDEHE